MNPRVKARVLALIEEELGLARAPARGGPDDVSQLLAEVAPLVRQIDVDQVVTVLSMVAAAWPDVEIAAIAWIDLIHVLVQNSEQRYRRGGHGDAKKAEVKAVLAELMRSSHVEVPDVPRSLQPIAIDLVADAAVDIIVAFLNRFPDARWKEAPARRTSVSGVGRELWLAVRRPLQAIVDALGRLITRLYLVLRPRTPLSPALRSAVRALEQESLIARERDLLERVGALFREVASDRQSTIAAIELVGVVVRIVERFVDAPGPEKKAIASEVVISVLSGLGFAASGPLTSAKIEGFVGFLIDSTVYLFNTRGQFSHAESAGGRPAPSGVR